MRNHCRLCHYHSHLYCYGHRLSGRGPRASHRNTPGSESLASTYSSPGLCGHQFQPILQTGASRNSNGHPACICAFCVPKARHRAPPARCCSRDFRAWMSSESPSWRGRVYAAHCLGQGTDGEVGWGFCPNIPRIEAYLHLSCRMYDSVHSNGCRGFALCKRATKAPVKIYILSIVHETAVVKGAHI